MLTLEQGTGLVKLARKVIESQILSQEFDFEEEKRIFSEKRGIFVTLNTYPDKKLRGCIGFLYPVKSLAEAIVEAAKSSAFSDPRFTPLQKHELDNVIIEVSVLTVPQEMQTKGQALLDEIVIGKDGLIVEYSGSSGLLLPQVASEQNWGTLEFLRSTCLKAGLSVEIWKNPDCKIFKFQAQIFSEKSPGGEVRESR